MPWFSNSTSHKGQGNKTKAFPNSVEIATWKLFAVGKELPFFSAGVEGKKSFAFQNKAQKIEKITFVLTISSLLYFHEKY